MGRAIDMYPRRTLLARLADDTPGGRLMSKDLVVGFFSDAWGFLPWAWGDDVVDELTLWRLDQSSPTLPVAPSSAPKPPVEQR